jgi:hypothetical protein
MMINVLSWILSIAAGLSVFVRRDLSDAGDHIAGCQRVRR